MLCPTLARHDSVPSLSLSINAGEIHAIIGPNGAGKSTLAYTLGGRPGYEATGGTAIFEGQDLLAMEPHEKSEEHTSELQSLMRISYAVFCLQKKINTIIILHKSQDNRQ